ncbi:hypothetical protein [Neglectibacter caecimuris]|uniref:hypothetical protein n=1 Tax=Neglectibacter caecimuris TaxID=3093658 RepID=UPI002AC92FC2|nr:hypothetical protein [Neglectibacter sp. M00184]
MKKFLSFLLSSVLVIQFSSHALAETTTSNNSTFDTVTNTSSAAEINEEAYALNTAFGIECVEETPLIEKRSQMPYSLIINNFSISDSKISLSADILFNNKKLLSLTQTGYVFFSESITQNETGQLTVLFEKQEGQNYKILNFSLFSSAIGELLLPIHKNLDKEYVFEFAIELDDKILYFESQLDNEEVYTALYNLASVSAEQESFPLNCLVADESNQDITLSELVHSSESWRFYAYSNHAGNTSVNEFPSDNLPPVASANATPIGLPAGAPATIFLKAGPWESANNPAKPQVGYCAKTAPYPGTGNMTTRLIMWEYVYGKCQNLLKGQDLATGGATSLRITVSGEYIYYAHNNTISRTYYDSYMRMSNIAIATGLMSNQQLLRRADSKLYIDNSGIQINWKEGIGIVPNQVFASAKALMDTIEYVPKDHNGCIEYQDTAKGQIAVYGKVIRGRRTSADSNKLGRDGDYITINFNIIQPSDLQRAAGQKEIVNKYYFSVYDRNPYTLQYTDKIIGTTQYRSSYYQVY